VKWAISVVTDDGDNARRVAILKAVLKDPTLQMLVGTNGEVFYSGA
jgi:hypothetical protein